MTPEDLACIHAAAFPDSGAWGATDFAELLDRPGVFVVAEGAGFAMGRVAADEAELLTVAVLPAHRRRGLGRSLLSMFAVGARARGAITAFLEVAEDNRAACALYAAAGFQIAGRRKAYYARGDGGAVDALILRKNLGEK